MDEPEIPTEEEINRARTRWAVENARKISTELRFLSTKKDGDPNISRVSSTTLMTASRAIDGLVDQTEIVRRLLRRDFGMITTVIDGVTLTSKAVVPGLSLHDLTMIFKKGTEEPDVTPLAGNPGRWPEVRGITRVLDAIFDSLKGEFEE